MIMVLMEELEFPWELLPALKKTVIISLEREHLSTMNSTTSHRRLLSLEASLTIKLWRCLLHKPTIQHTTVKKKFMFHLMNSCQAQLPKETLVCISLLITFQYSAIIGRRSARNNLPEVFRGGDRKLPLHLRDVWQRKDGFHWNLWLANYHAFSGSWPHWSYRPNLESWR